MASLTDQKLMEMEAEMNRFEQEIQGQGPPGLSRFVLGANTFRRMQARLSSKPDGEDDDSNDEFQVPWASVDMASPMNSVPAMAPPPPPPEPIMSKNSEPTTVEPLKPPPPPPSFLPPQIRHHRPSPQRPPLPSWQGPPRPPHGMRMPMHPGMRMPPPGMGQMGPWGAPQGPYQGPTMPGPDYSRHHGPEEKKDLAVIEAKPMLTKLPSQLEKKKMKKDKKKRAESAETFHTEQQLPAVILEPEQPHQHQMADDASSDMMELVEAGGEVDDDPNKPGTSKDKKKRKYIRYAAGTKWEDESLTEWNPDDFRVFCGDLGNEVTDETLIRAFSRYPSFQKAKVIRDKRSNKTRGYGFVSFRDPNDFVRAIREMNGKYVGNRPIKLRKSQWRDRNIEVVRKKEKEKKRLGLR
ncbi:RNA-binding protein 42-like [Tubulanus polymorphus]|uniref:RNA-binding protein 42-like n=1 Tax=Tubulanus polymorphus TaxID=672921 RepID=UPI003DA23B99